MIFRIPIKTNSYFVRSKNTLVNSNFMTRRLTSPSNMFNHSVKVIDLLRNCYNIYLKRFTEKYKFNQTVYKVSCGMLL